MKMLSKKDTLNNIFLYILLIILQCIQDLKMEVHA